MHWLQSWVNLGEVDLILILKISKKKKRQLKQNHFRGHPRRGSFGACVPKVQPQQPCESALVPFDKHQGEPSARAGPTHIESLLQRIEDASKQNCQEIVKQLLGEVSRCCSLLEAKGCPTFCSCREASSRWFEVPSRLHALVGASFRQIDPKLR